MSVVIAPETSNARDLITLPHPVTGSGALFAIDQESLCLVKRLDSEGTHSFFVDNNVISDGSVTFLLQFNPLYVLLPILEKKAEKTNESNGKFLSLEDILHSEEFPDLALFENLTHIEDNLKLICDFQEISSLKFYRINKDKLIKFLKEKIDFIFNNYEKFELFQLLRNQEALIKEDCLQDFRKRHSLLVFGDYLSEKLLKQMFEEFNVEFKVNYKEKYSYFVPEAKPSKASVKVEAKKPKTVDKAKGMKPLTTWFKKQ